MATSGRNHHFYGKHHSDKTKKKISESNIGKKLSVKAKAKMSRARVGVRFSEDHKKNLSKSLKISSLKGKNHPRYGKCISEETREKMRLGKKLSWMLKNKNKIQKGE